MTSISARIPRSTSAVGETRISAGDEIDNLVHIAHGVTIGRRALLAAQVGIAAARWWKRRHGGGQSGVTANVRVGKGAIIAEERRLLQSVDAGAFVTGHPAIQHAEWRKASVVFGSCPRSRSAIEDRCSSASPSSRRSWPHVEPPDR